MLINPDDSRVFGPTFPGDFRSKFPSRAEPGQTDRFSGLKANVNAYSIAQATSWQDALRLGLKATYTSELTGGVASQLLPAVIGGVGDGELLFPGSGGAPVLEGIFSTVLFRKPSRRDVDAESIVNDLAQRGFREGIDWVTDNTGIWGTVAKAGIAVARFLLGLAFQTDDTVQLKQMPWRQFSKLTDEEWVNIYLVPMFLPSPDWTALFEPPMDPSGGFEPGEDTRMPFQNRGYGALDVRGNPVFTQGFGFMPGTSRMAECVQVAGDEPPGVPRLDDITNVGDFYPGTSQFLMCADQMIQRVGSPDMFKVRPGDLQNLWRRYFEAYFRSGWSWIEHLRGTKSDANKITALFTAKALTEYMGVHSRASATSPWHFGQIGLEHARFLDGAGIAFTTAFTPQALTAFESPDGWVRPLGFGNAMWNSVYDAAIKPALNELKRRQKRALAHSLVCAYVRYYGQRVGGIWREPFAAFEDKGPPLTAGYNNWGHELREYCKAMRELFLSHMDRYKVRNQDVELIDPDFARRLADSKRIAPEFPVQARPLTPLNPSEPEPGPAHLPEGGLPFAAALAEPPPTPPGPPVASKVMFGASVAAAAGAGGVLLYDRLRG